MSRSGQDIAPIANRMQRVGPLVQGGKLAEAEKILDEVLNLLGEKVK